jgi:hypothetical protein
MTRPLIHWRVLAIRVMFGRPLAYRAVTAGPGWIKIRQNLLAVAYRAKSLSNSRCDDCNMPTVAPTIARIATVGKVDAESWQNPPNLDSQFLHDGCGTLRTVALRRPIFKPKKGSSTISLGLNYYSIGLSQPPFRDTISLMSVQLNQNLVCSVIGLLIRCPGRNAEFY